MSESYISQLNYITRVNQDMKYIVFKFASGWRGAGWELGLKNFENGLDNGN